jgi:hypothetical protein
MQRMSQNGGKSTVKVIREKPWPYLVTYKTDCHKNALCWTNTRGAIYIEISLDSISGMRVTQVNWNLDALTANDHVVFSLTRLL